LLSQITDDGILINGGDFRLVDKSILKLLREIHDGKPYVRGLISSLARNQIGVPYTRDRRVAGESKFPVMRLTALAIDGIVSHSTIPLRLASLAGMFVSLAMFILAVTYSIGKIYFGLKWPTGFTTQVVIMLFGISINAIFLGIIGEYLARIYHQLRQQPLTIIKDKLNFPDSISPPEGFQSTPEKSL
jgi:dolichol-phosphate mannosyltransferase